MSTSADRPLLFFGVTPPRLSAGPEDSQRVADVTIQRLKDLDLDALVLYDIDDESDRNPDERPFPYLPTQDPVGFHERCLAAWDRPVVLYRSVGKYHPHELQEWLTQTDPARVRTVFVGASSGDKNVRTSLTQAQAIRQETRPEVPLGAVAIAERHTAAGTEHLRMLAKQDQGVTFFVSQVVYDTEAAKSMVSDYFYECRARGVDPVPVVFTLSVCGSTKTLAFLGWLGVEVPRWLRNDLVHAEDPLVVSYQRCRAIAEELANFCERLGAPYGFNVESVSIRRAEIEASVRLAAELRTR